MTESRNIGADGESLMPVDVARGTSGAVRSMDAERRRRQRGLRKEGRRPFKTAICHRH
jgi:hypothetical protein